MSETDPSTLPPDYDAPGQVDFPDPAFDAEDDADDLEVAGNEEPDESEQ